MNKRKIQSICIFDPFWVAHQCASGHRPFFLLMASQSTQHRLFDAYVNVRWPVIKSVAGPEQEREPLGSTNRWYLGSPTTVRGHLYISTRCFRSDFGLYKVMNRAFIYHLPLKMNLKSTTFGSITS